MTDINELSEGLFIEGYIEADEKALNQRKKNEELLLAYKHMLTDPYGRQVIWDILDMCGVFRLSMTGNSWTYFNEGKTSIGLYVMSMLNLGNRFEDVLGFQQLKPEKKDG